MIDKFIEKICGILNIEKPVVSFDTSNFSTPTMSAQCSPDGGAIHLKKMDKPTPDYLFAISHELRHVWQIRTDSARWLPDYQPADRLTVEEYNNQQAELDANAFATAIMADAFGIIPKFDGISESTKARIYERAKEIAKEAE